MGRVDWNWNGRKRKKEIKNFTRKKKMRNRIYEKKKKRRSFGQNNFKRKKSKKQQKVLRRAITPQLRQQRTIQFRINSPHRK